MWFSRQLERGNVITIVLLLLVGLSSVAQPVSAQTASLKIPKFYTISRASYDTWVSTHKDLPAPLKTFAANTTDVGYIVGYAGATPKVSTFHVTIYDGSGKVFLTGRVRTLTFKSGYFTNYFPRFPGRMYKMKLLVNGKAAGSASFSVRP